MPDWLWQGAAYDILKWLAIVAAAVAVPYLKARGSKWASPIIYGLGAATLMAVLVYGIPLAHNLSRVEPRLTTENAETYVRSWLDNFKYGVQRADEPGQKFRLKVTSPSGARSFFVRQSNDRTEYLVLSVIIQPSGGLQERLGGLTEAQTTSLIRQLKVEMVRQGIAYGNVTMAQVPISRSIPITEQLTEGVFMSHILAMEGAIASVALIMEEELTGEG